MGYGEGAPEGTNVGSRVGPYDGLDVEVVVLGLGPGLGPPPPPELGDLEGGHVWSQNEVSQAFHAVDELPTL